MEVLVLDAELNVVSILDNFESMLWSERYNSYGDFEVYTTASLSAVASLQEDYYLWLKGSDRLMIIEDRKIESSVDDGVHLTVTGRSLESILDRRIIWSPTVLDGNFQNGIKKLIDESIIAPSISARKIPNFIFETSTDPAITALTVSAQFNRENLYDAVQALCDSKSIGFKVGWKEASKNLIRGGADSWESGQYNSVGAKEDTLRRVKLKDLVKVRPSTAYCFTGGNENCEFVVRTYNAAKQFVSSWSSIGARSIRVTEATVEYLGISFWDNRDLTTSDEFLSAIRGNVVRPFIGEAIGDYMQDRDDKWLFVFKLYSGVDRSYDQDTTPYVVFSPKFDNLLNSNYVESKKPLKTVSLVVGEGEGAEQKSISVEIEGGGGSGLLRREMFTDASNVSSTVTIDSETYVLPEAEYNAQLTQLGKEALSENSAIVVFEGEADTTLMFTYGKDFSMGDIVQIANEFGLESKSRVVELIRSQDLNGERTYPTFSAIN